MTIQSVFANPVTYIDYDNAFLDFCTANVLLNYVIVIKYIYIAVLSADSQYLSPPACTDTGKNS